MQGPFQPSGRLYPRRGFSPSELIVQTCSAARHSMRSPVAAAMTIDCSGELRRVLPKCILILAKMCVAKVCQPKHANGMKASRTLRLGNSLTVIYYSKKKRHKIAPQLKIAVQHNSTWIGVLLVSLGRVMLEILIAGFVVP